MLLTAWNAKRASGTFWSSLIEFLLDRGATSFISIGDYSEQLHDEIDELVYRYNDLHGTKISPSIMTTFHTNDTGEDGVYFFIHCTDFKSNGKNCMLAILDDGSVEDQKVAKLLKII